MLEYFFGYAINNNKEIAKSINEIFSNFYEGKAIKQKCKSICSKINDIKKESINNNDEVLANSTFILKVLLRFLLEYSIFINFLKKDEYDNSWIHLQNAKDSLDFINRHTSFDGIDIMQELFDNIEKLYPYNIFFSMDAKVIRVCSICRKNEMNCNHVFGQLYWGECANPIITKIEKLNSVSMVSDPKNKRCVVKYDNNQFKCVIFAKKFLLTPFYYFKLYPTKTKKIEDRDIVMHYEIEPKGQIRINIFNSRFL